jgi:tRNA threonylcarbamoyladenosine biosynthesis protein TsaB
MLLLAIDTSGKYGSIALARADESLPSGLEVLEVVPLQGGTFSAQLVPQIAALLGKHSLTKDRIGAFVVASGPGSFTGLRVGLAATKALAEILQKPIVPVSLLEVAVLASGKQGRLSALLDAGRGEFYVGKYHVDAGNADCLSERIETKDNVVATTRGTEVITPDPAIADLVRQSGASVLLIAPLNAGAIALVGLKKLLAGQTVSPEQLEANYIRRSEAEIFAKTSR